MAGTEEGGSTIEEAFKAACASVWEQRHSDEFASVRLQLYGLYKVAVVGKCEEPKPDMVLGVGGEQARSKWDAWMKASTFSQEEAMTRYVSVALSMVKSRGDAVEENVASAAAASKSGDGSSRSLASGESKGSFSREDAGASGRGMDGVTTGEAGTAEGSEGGKIDEVVADAPHAVRAQQEEIERLRKHTESLERYVAMIRDELSIATDGIDEEDRRMSGWLSKWRDRDVYLWGSSKWEPRFFTLVGDTLTTYKSEKSMDVESVMSLKRCVLRDEGTKKGKPHGRGKPAPEYYVFGLYLEGALQRGPDAGVLLRLSSDEEKEAARWMSALNDVCAHDDSEGSESSEDDASSSTGAVVRGATTEVFPSPSLHVTFQETKAGAGASDKLYPGRDPSAPDDAAAASRPLDAPLPEITPSGGGIAAGSSFGRGLARKGSWDVAGGMSNLGQLKRLSRRLSQERLDLDNESEAVKAAATSAAVAAVEKEKAERKEESQGGHKKKKKKFDATGYPASRPMHKEAKASLLSGDAPTQNYRGLLNLMAILLLVTNSRLIFGNLRRYGVLASVPRVTAPGDLYEAPRVAGYLLLCFHTAFALGVEKLAMPRPGREGGLLGGSEAPVLFLHTTNLVALITIATAIVWTSQGSPVFGFAYLFTAVILWLKLISYAHANRDLRLAWREKARAAKSKESAGTDSWRGQSSWSLEGIRDTSDGGGQGVSGLRPSDPPARAKHNASSSTDDTARRARSAGERGGGDEDTPTRTRYPSNINVRDILYFWFAPTLCYQPDYPVSGKRRYRYIVSLLIRLVVVGGAMGLIADQYMLPTVHEFYGEPPTEKNILISLERLLTLAVPNTYFWLLGFYAFFHLTLNLLAEILRFGDRMFYRDWWNANTIDSYWRLWNTPVHYWMVRHVYFPSLRAGLSKNMASTLCFLVSAILHELLVSVPFHMVKFYAFVGMLGNVPMVPLTKMLSKKLGDDQQAGNWFFWVLFCVVGQPMSLLCYYRDYCSTHECSNPLLG